MKHFLVRIKDSHKNNQYQLIDVYKIEKNILTILFTYKLNTASFKGYRDNTLNKLAELGYVPKKYKYSYMYEAKNIEIQQI